MDIKNFKFQRGSRILEAIALEEATLPELEKNIVFGFPETKKRQHATDSVSIRQLKLTPYKNTTDLLSTAQANSEGNTYDPKILFLRVEYEDEDNNENVTFTASDGDSYNMRPISLKKSNVKVSCTCMDFYWRFAVHNNNADSLYGDVPPPYQKKTDRPPVNPKKVPGICKHLIKTIKSLRDAGLITD